MKDKVDNLLKLLVETVSRPVALSRVAPVADLYLLNPLVAIKMRVVPVSTIPAVLDRMVVEPYLIDWLMPQYSLAGEVEVMGLSVNNPMSDKAFLTMNINTYMKVIEPVNLLLSVPPQVISPFRSLPV